MEELGTASGSKEALMMLMPIKSMPKPKTMYPTRWIFLFLMNIWVIAPKRTRRGAMAVSLKDTRIPVMVVPMLEPMMTPMACCAS